MQIESKRKKGERRRVIIIFAEVKGLTDKTRINIVKSLTNIIHKYEGYIDKVFSDTIMALFGAPIAHFDDTERAILTALSIKKELLNINKRLNLDLSIRIGIARGLVYAGEYAKEGEYTVLGKFVNLAKHLQEVCKENTIYTSKEVFELTRHLVLYKDTKQLELKGIGIYKGYECHKLKPVETREKVFVGRIIYLRTLNKYYKNLSKKGKTLFITGDRGIGKTRLWRRFRNTIQGKKNIVIEIRAKEYLKNELYYALTQMINQIFGLSNENNKTKIFTIQRFFNKLPHLNFTIPYIKYILKLPLTEEEQITINLLEEQNKENIIFNILINLFVELSRINPLIITIEDSQYLDAGSKNFFKSFCTFTHLSKILLLMLQWKIDTSFSNAKEIRLRPLSKKNIHELLRLKLDNRKIGKDLFDFVSNKTKGNPLFIEELISALKEKNYITSGYIAKLKGKTIEVPDRIYDIILSRFDMLTKDEKLLLQYSSVIGFEFSSLILKMLLRDKNIEKILKNLEPKDIFEYVKTEKIGKKTSRIYFFKNENIKKVIYETLLKKERELLHRIVGETLERLFKKTSNAHLDELSYHFVQAHSKKALKYLIQSGISKSNAYRLDEALEDFNKYLKIKNSPYVQFNIGRVFYLKSQFVNAHEYLDKAIRHTKNKGLKALILDLKGATLREEGKFFESLKTLKKIF